MIVSVRGVEFKVPRERAQASPLLHQSQSSAGTIELDCSVHHFMKWMSYQLWFDEGTELCHLVDFLQVCSHCLVLQPASLQGLVIAGSLGLTVTMPQLLTVTKSTQ